MDVLNFIIFHAKDSESYNDNMIAVDVYLRLGCDHVFFERKSKEIYL